MVPPYRSQVLTISSVKVPILAVGSFSSPSGNTSPFQPSRIPRTSHSIFLVFLSRSSNAVFTTHLIAEFSPAQSPPPVRTPILLFSIFLSNSLGQSSAESNPIIPGIIIIRDSRDLLKSILHIKPLGLFVLGEGRGIR